MNGYGLMETMKRDGRIHSDSIGMVMAEEECRAFDDVTGEELDFGEVCKARALEMSEVGNHKVHINT